MSETPESLTVHKGLIQTATLPHGKKLKFICLGFFFTVLHPCVTESSRACAGTQQNANSKLNNVSKIRIS